MVVCIQNTTIKGHPDSLKRAHEKKKNIHTRYPRDASLSIEVSRVLRTWSVMRVQDTIAAYVLHNYITAQIHGSKSWHMTTASRLTSDCLSPSSININIDRTKSHSSSRLPHRSTSSPTLSLGTCFCIHAVSGSIPTSFA
jgi:hypothetical protein